MAIRTMITLFLGHPVNKQIDISMHTCTARAVVVAPWLFSA